MVKVNWQAAIGIVTLVSAAARYIVWQVGAIFEEKLRERDNYWVKSAKSTVTGAELERRLRRLEHVSE